MHQNEVSRRALSDRMVFVASGMISDCRTVSGPNIIGHLKTVLCAVHFVRTTYQRDFLQKFMLYPYLSMAGMVGLQLN